MGKGRTKREREPLGEPTTEQASEYHHIAESSRAQAWEMHLRGIPRTRIAVALGINRATVAKIINGYYAETATERKISAARKLDGAVQRMRRLQEQAWADHDADDEREQAVLALASSPDGENGSDGASEPDGNDPGMRKRGRESNGPSVTVRYQSQRSQYLRIILDAEKEIARLEGLYDSLLDVEGAVGFVVIREAKGAQSGQIATSATLRGIPAPTAASETEPESDI